MKIKTCVSKFVGPIDTVLRGKLITLNAYLRKEKVYQINNLSSYFKKFEKR